VLADERADRVAREKSIEVLFAIYQRDLHADDSHGFYTSTADQLVRYATPLERHTIAEWIREALADEEQEITGSERQAYGKFWLDLQKESLDDEAYLRICRETGRTSDLIDRLLALGRIDLAHQGDPAFLLQVALHQSKGRAVPLQRLVAMVAPGVILQVVVDRVCDGRVGAAVCQESPLLVLPIGFPGRFLCFLRLLLHTRFGLCSERSLMRMSPVPCHMFAASECAGSNFFGCLGVILFFFGHRYWPPSGFWWARRQSDSERGKRQDVAFVRRQAVTPSPLAWFTSALQPVSYGIHAM